MRKLLLLLGFVGLVSLDVLAATFNSAQVGNWNDGPTWGSINSPGTAGVDYPGAGDIANIGHVITIPAGVTASAATITISNSATARLVLSSGSPGGQLNLTGTLTLGTSGTRGRIEVSGILQMDDGSTIANANTSRLVIFNGGTYKMNYTTGGVIYDGDFQSGSTLLFSGYSNGSAAAPTLANSPKTFHHVTWNCTNQGNDIDLNGILSAVNGDLKVLSTSSNIWFLYLTQSTTASLAINGNFDISGDSYVYLTGGSATSDVTVAGNLSVSGTNSNFGLVLAGNTGAATLNISGNLTLSSSSFIDFTEFNGAGSINLTGNLSVTSGQLKRSGSGTSTIDFVGDVTHTYGYSGTAISSTINFHITANDVVDFGTSSVSGSGTFLVDGTIRVGSTDASGAIQTGTAAGNIRTSGTRTYSSGSTIIYNGASAQTIGNGQPTGSGITTRINNSAGVSLSNSIVIVGTIILDNGNLSVGSNTLTMNGTFTPNSNSLVTTTNSNISIGGSGAFGTLSLSGSTTIATFTLNRGSSGTVTLGSDMTIKNFGTFTLQDGSLILNGKTLTISGDFVTSAPNTGTVTGDASASIVVDGSGTFSPLSLSGSALGTLTIGRSATTIPMSPSGGFTVTTLNLTAGTLSNGGSIVIGSIINRSLGSMTGNLPGGTPYDVSYSNTSGITTGIELPTAPTAVKNLTVGGSGLLTLGNDLTVNTLLTLNGAFDSNGKAIDLKGNTSIGVAPTLTSSTVTVSGVASGLSGVSPTFGNLTITGTFSPSINYQVNGVLDASAGTLNNGSVTTIFGGSPSSIVGAPTFNNVTVSGTLTGPATLNISGVFTNNGTYNAGSGTINISGNWTNNTTNFNCQTGTVTFAGNTTVGGSQPTIFNHITISNTLTAPSSLAMSVGGNFTNNGTFNNNGGAITFVANGASQSISGSSTTFNNINANNSFGTVVNTTVRLNGTLTLNASGVFNASGGGGNFIVSSTSQTAGGMIAALPTPANFSGNVTVERFIQGASGGDYRYLSMPVTNGDLSLWKSSIFVTGNFSDRSTNADNSNISDSGNTNPSVFTWDSNAQAYVGLTAGGGLTSSVALSSRIGYVAYDFNNGSVTPGFNGPIEKGTVPVTISATLNNFNLVPNPYPAPIDWDNVTKTNVNNAMWLRSANNFFSSYVGGVATNLPFGGWSGEVAIGQSFWVQSNAGGTTLNFNESDKTSNSFKFLRKETPENYIRIQLYSASQQDEAVIHFVNGATDGIDSQFDAVKRRNGNYISSLGQNNYMNISSFIANSSTDYSINSVAELGKDPKVIKLKIVDVTPGNFSLKFTDLSTFSLGYKIYLEDHFLNQEKVVSEDFVYDFSVTQNVLTYGDSRFALRFESISVITAVADESANETRVYPNPVSTKLFIKLSSSEENDLKGIVLYDLMGKPLVSSERDRNLMAPGIKSIDMIEFPSGFYVLNISSGNVVKSIRVIKK